MSSSYLHITISIYMQISERNLHIIKHKHVQILFSYGNSHDSTEINAAGTMPNAL